MSLYTPYKNELSNTNCVQGICEDSPSYSSVINGKFEVIHELITSIDNKLGLIKISSLSKDENVVFVGDTKLEGEINYVIRRLSELNESLK